MNDFATSRRRETPAARLEDADPRDGENARLRKDYGKEVAPIIADVLLMGRGMYDTPLAMANALIKRLAFEGYGIRKDK